MRYMMKSGELILPENGKILAKAKNSFWEAKKMIVLPEEDMRYVTEIEYWDVKEERKGNVQYRIYKMKDSSGNVLMEACPGYAKDEDPAVSGWPICRVPRVDHAYTTIEGEKYLLMMHNTQNYSLENQKGDSILRIMHKGISGGWIIDTSEKFAVQIIYGIFLFCRYIEQENEFAIV